MKMYKEAYATGGASSKDDFKKKDYKKSGNYKKDGYKKNSYKKGDYKKKSYNKGGAPRDAQQAAPEKKTFWQKVKSFFGR